MSELPDPELPEVKLIEAETDAFGITSFDLEALTTAEAMCLAIDAIARVAKGMGKTPMEIARTIVETGEEGGIS